MFSDSTGGGNVAMGYHSLLDNNSGANNVAIGTSALENNTTAQDNTAVGYQALFTQTTASTGQNTAVGYQAGYTTNGSAPQATTSCCRMGMVILGQYIKLYRVRDSGVLTYLTQMLLRFMLTPLAVVSLCVTMACLE